MSRALYLAKISVVQHPSLGALAGHEFQHAFPNKDFTIGVVATGPDGEPTQLAALVMVASVDHTPYRGNPNIIPLPFDNKNSTVGATATELRMGARNAVVEMGFDAAQTYALWANTTPVRDLLDFYGKLNDPAFSIDNFDLYEA